MVCALAMAKKPQRAAKILIVPDTHVPYEDTQAWALMLKAAKTLNGGQGPDAIVLLGDFFDCYELSTHEKSPLRRASLAEELQAAGKRLAELENLVVGKPAHKALRWHSDDRSWGKADSKNPKNFRRLYWILGNHENRINRALGRDPQRGVLSTYMSAGLLQHRTLDHIFPQWTFVDYMHTLFCQNAFKGQTRAFDLALTHDVGKAGQTAHLDAGRVFGPVSVVIGHTHRVAHATHTVGGATHTATMIGWLGDAGEIGYLAAARAAREWALGFGVATVGAGGVDMAPVVIRTDGAGGMACVVDGVSVTGD